MGAPVEMAASINGAPRVNGNANANGDGPLALSYRIKMERKQSSPMAPPFMVSAPGKVIVWGEHAVVHGKVGASFALAVLWRTMLTDY